MAAAINLLDLGYTVDQVIILGGQLLGSSLPSTIGESFTMPLSDKLQKVDSQIAEDKMVVKQEEDDHNYYFNC